MPGHSLLKRYLPTASQRAVPLEHYEEIKIVVLKSRRFFNHLERTLYNHPNKNKIVKLLSNQAQRIIQYSNQSNKTLFQTTLLSSKDEQLLKKQFDPLSWRTAFSMTKTIAACYPKVSNPYFQQPLKQVSSYVCFQDLLDEVTHCEQYFKTQLEDAIIIAQQTKQYRLWWHLFWVKQRLFGHQTLRLARLIFNTLIFGFGLFITTSSLVTLTSLSNTLHLVTPLSMPWSWLLVGLVIMLITFHKITHDQTLTRFWPNALHTFSLSDPVHHKGVKRFKYLTKNFGLIPRETHVKPRGKHQLLKILINPARPLLSLSQLCYLGLAFLIDVLCLTNLFSPTLYISAIIKFALHIPFTLLDIGLEVIIDCIDFIWELPKTLISHTVGIGIIAYQRLKSTKTSHTSPTKTLWHEQVNNHNTFATISIKWQQRWWNLTKVIATNVIKKTPYKTFKAYYTNVVCKQLKNAPTKVYFNEKDDYDYIECHEKKLPLSSLITMVACHRLILSKEPNNFLDLYHLPRFAWLTRVFDSTGRPRFSINHVPTQLKQEYLQPNETLKAQFKDRYKNRISPLQYKRHYRNIAKWWQSLRTLLKNDKSLLKNPATLAECNELLHDTIENHHHLMARVEQQLLSNGKTINPDNVVARLTDNDTGSDHIPYCFHFMYSNLNTIYNYIRNLYLRDSNHLPEICIKQPPLKLFYQKANSEESKNTLHESIEQQWRRHYNSTVKYGFYAPYGGALFFQRLATIDQRFVLSSKVDTSKVGTIPEKNDYLYKISEDENFIEKFDSRVNDQVHTNNPWFESYGMNRP